MLYQNKEPGVSSEVIEGKVELYNRADETADFNGVEIHYFFDPDGFIPQVEITSNNAEDVLVSEIIELGSDSFISFRIADTFLVNSDRRLQFKFEVTNATGAAFDQSNDLSFIASQTSLAPTPSIQVNYPVD